jgi:hypothetical protein
MALIGSAPVTFWEQASPAAPTNTATDVDK